MMQLVANIRHIKPVNNLAESRAIWIDINRRKIIGFLDTRASIDRNRVKQQFSWGSNRLFGTSITRAATFHLNSLADHTAHFCLNQSRAELFGFYILITAISRTV